MSPRAGLAAAERALAEVQERVRRDGTMLTSCSS